jgi:hypothetical protein
MSEKGMQILHKINLFPYLKQIDLDFCEHCVYGKQKRVRFLRVGKEKKSEKFELVDTYVWVLTQKSALGSTWCFTQLLLHKIPLVPWFQSKTVAGVIVTMASALERVSVGCFQGFVGLPMAFLPHVKAVLFKDYNSSKWYGSEQAFQ